MQHASHYRNIHKMNGHGKTGSNGGSEASVPLEILQGESLQGLLILDRFQDETNNDTIAACQDHDTSIGNSSRKRKPSLPKPPISES
jgi:hypothetical protein